MKRFMILAALSATLMTSGCVTINGAEGEVAWHGEGAQPFAAARDMCRASTGQGQLGEGFRECMAAKGWTRSLVL